MTLQSEHAKCTYGLKDSSCTCRKCQEMCEHRPCWGTPDQMEALMDMGLANRLMWDYWAGNFTQDRQACLDDPDCWYYDIPIIAPAIVGREGKSAPSWPTGRCTFLKNGRCEIYANQPLEGSVAHHADEDGIAHEVCARMWDTPEGKAAVDRWYRELGKKK